MTIYVNDTGVTISLETKFDIQTMTKFEMHVKKPDGRLRKWTASLSGTTAMVYTLITGDINIPGVYTLQAYVEGPGVRLHGLPVSFTASHSH